MSAFGDRLVLAAALLAVGAPVTANAGTYTVGGCRSAPNASADTSWAFWTDMRDTDVDVQRTCVAGSDEGELFLRDRRSGTEAEPGRVAEWRWTSPLGATISRVTVRYTAGKRNNSFKFYAATEAGALTFEDCSVVGAAYDCRIPADGEPDSWTLQVGRFSIGVRCGSTGSHCASGGELPAFWLAIQSSTVEIEDFVLPEVATTSGPEVPASRYVSGTIAASGRGTDNVGIKRIGVFVDGSQRVSTDLACDYGKAVPCPTPAEARDLRLDTATFADGPHTVKIGLTDTAGNVAFGPAADLVVDNTAPAPPQVVTPTITGDRARIEWRIPDGQVAPVSGEWSLCRLDSAETCRWGSVDGGGLLQAVADLPVQAGGRYQVEVNLVDAAGNRAVRPATATFSVAAPDSGGTGGRVDDVASRSAGTAGGTGDTSRGGGMPCGFLRARLASNRRAIRLAGTTGAANGARLTVRVSFRRGGRRVVRTRALVVRSGRLAATLRLGRAADRRHRVRVTVPGRVRCL